MKVVNFIDTGFMLTSFEYVVLFMLSCFVRIKVFRMFEPITVNRREYSELMFITSALILLFFFVCLSVDVFTDE